MGAAWAAAWLGACATVGPPPRPEDPALANRSALPVERQERLLVPAAPLLGGRLAPTDPTGVPRPGSLGAYRNFQAPTAVAVRGPDVYVVDSSRREILRFDVAQQSVTVPVPIRPTPETRIRAGADGSLYVLDPATRSILRFSRAGQRLGVYADAVNLVRPVDFVVDEARGRVIAADATYQQLLAFHPAGQASYVGLGAGGERGPVRAIVAMSLTPGGVAISDAACGCIVELGAESGQLAAFGHDDLSQPGALAADAHGRLFVLDNGDRSLKVFAERRLIASLTYRALGLTSPAGLAADGGALYVADGVSGRVAVFRIAPPGRGDRR
jgi:DNA-binding beta-propeller fold protein YncE